MGNLNNFLRKMEKPTGKNRFAGAAFDDSDDEVVVNRSKVQKKTQAA